MPEVGSDLEFPTMIKPCPDCGEPVIEAHNSSDLDADSIFFDLEPAGKGVQLQWKDNDKLPTIAKVHEIHRIHECP